MKKDLRYYRIAKKCPTCGTLLEEIHRVKYTLTGFTTKHLKTICPLCEKRN